MPNKYVSVSEYLDTLPEDRRVAIETVRAEILKNLPEGYEEGIQYNMIGYYVPHSIFPDGYHCDPKEPLPFVGLGAQKSHMAVYLFCVYVDGQDDAWFREAYLATGKKLDMGASCVRFKKLENLPVELIGEVVARYPVEKFVAGYVAARDARKSAKKK